jgi:ribosomal RNA-processing protein 12
VIFQSLDRSQLEAQGVRQTFASILQICIDPRPKVRKKAADLVKEVLANPPTPLVRHPYAEQVAESLNHTLAEVNAGPLVKGKASTQVVAPGAESAIHALAFLNPIVGYLLPTPCSMFPILFPSSYPHCYLQSLPPITNHLLALPHLGNPYLSQSCYSIMSDIKFTASIDDVCMEFSGFKRCGNS